MRKIVITLPNHLAQAIDDMCHRQRIPRSRIVQEAVAQFLEQEDEAEAVLAYIQGYRRKPESTEEAEGFAKATTKVLEPEDWS